MAKNRRIPFGYQMKNGEIVTEPRELYAVSKIFADYLKGKSLLEISRSMQDTLEPRHIHSLYLPTSSIVLIIKKSRKPLISVLSLMN